MATLRPAPAVLVNRSALLSSSNSHLESSGAEFQKLFLDTWHKQKGPSISEQIYVPDPKEVGDALVRALGSTPGETNRITFVAYVAAITFAQHSIHLTNAYFVPDDRPVTDRIMKWFAHLVFRWL